MKPGNRSSWFPVVGSTEGASSSMFCQVPILSLVFLLEDRGDSVQNGRHCFVWVLQAAGRSVVVLTDCRVIGSIPPWLLCVSMVLRLTSCQGKISVLPSGMRYVKPSMQFCMHEPCTHIGIERELACHTGNQNWTWLLLWALRPKMPTARSLLL